MKPKGVSLTELNKLQKKAANGDRFTAEDERRIALKILGADELTAITQAQRARVLRRAQKINDC